MQLPLLSALPALAFLSAQSCSPAVDISTSWHLLGPFQLGTREAEWTSDPLSRFGGFEALSPSNGTFLSALCTNGTASWSTTTSSGGSVTVSFPTVDWDALRSVYGWSALQFQAWARGEVVLCSEARVALYISGAAAEFSIAGRKHVGGDYYEFRRAPLVVKLPAGRHAIDVRVAHDVRAFGGVDSVKFRVEAAIVKGELSVGDGVMVSDVVSGRMVGEWVSVPVRNDGEGWIRVVSVLGKSNLTKLADFEPVSLAPGQSRPLKLRVTDIPADMKTLELVVRYQWVNEDKVVEVLATKDLNFVEHWFQPQKYTFLHPSGIVSYAVLRPPSLNASCKVVKQKLPIILSLHGAGVEADSPQNKESYDGLPDLCAWVVLPSGGTTWSGDDWHRWGFSDVEAAIAAIPQWMKKVNWMRQGVALDKWVVSGHSNGGQGAWYALTHRSDKIIAAAPLSGYLSIPAYVPYHVWHEADPRKSAMVLAALNSYKHELLATNVRGTPVLQQHGQDDDNVPIYHSRRMNQLIAEVDWSTEYWEIPGRGHWWEGVMTDNGLPDFLNHYLNEMPVVPQLPGKFSLIVANPADMGPRGGIAVDQLEEPDRIGRIDVETQGTTWLLTTSNVRRWHFAGLRSNTGEYPRRVIVDEQSIPIPIAWNSSTTYLLVNNGFWMTTEDAHWKSVERAGRQWGALDAFIASQGRFRIVVPSGAKAYEQAAALDASRNLYQYFAADTEITIQPEDTNADGNVIFFGRPSPDLPCAIDGFPITISDKAIAIVDAMGKTKRLKIEAGMGAIYICPLPRERLMLVLWGADEGGLLAAARLLPLRTGVGQPDFVVVARASSWAGVGGAKALGMFDSTWQVSRASYV